VPHFSLLLREVGFPTASAGNARVGRTLLSDAFDVVVDLAFDLAGCPTRGTFTVGRDADGAQNILHYSTVTVSGSLYTFPQLSQACTTVL
jgi:hypothetical protein